MAAQGDVSGINNAVYYSAHGADYMRHPARLSEEYDDEIVVDDDDDDNDDDDDDDDYEEDDGYDDAYDDCYDDGDDNDDGDDDDYDYGRGGDGGDGGRCIVRDGDRGGRMSHGNGMSVDARFHLILSTFYRCIFIITPMTHTF